jgi:hypothetical protein
MTLDEQAEIAEAERTSIKHEREASKRAYRDTQMAKQREKNAQRQQTVNALNSFSNSMLFLAFVAFVICLIIWFL